LEPTRTRGPRRWRKTRQIAGYRIEKRTIEITVGPARDQLSISRFDLGPHLHVSTPRLQLAADRRHTPCDPLFIELDARYGIALRRMPILGEEILCGTPRNAPELLVV
jgi:hypothetical protein